MSLTRVLMTTAVTVTHTFYSDEGPVDATGNVTATLKRLDGTPVGSPATAGHPGPPGAYTFPVPASAVLDTQRLEWSGTFGGVTITVADYIEHVGDFLFGLAEVRAAHKFMADVNRYPTSMLATKRTEVEQEFENITGQAWVPRFGRFALNGRNFEQLATPVALIRKVRSVSISGTPMAQSDVDLITPTDTGILRRPTGVIWPLGYRNVIVELEHGADFAPEPLKEAGILRLRSRIGMTSTGIPDRAISWNAAEGGVYRLSVPGRLATGVPEVDGILQRPEYGRRRLRPAVA